MLIPANRKYPTRRIGSRQQRVRTHIDSLCKPKITRRKCEICKRNFRDYRILVDGGMRYMLCKNHLAFARKNREHFLMVVEAFRLGTPVAELGAVV